mgnify:CR=1 FL=1
MNWHFGTIATYKNIQEFSYAAAKWTQSVWDSDATTEIYDSYVQPHDGRWNNPKNTTWLDFYMKLGRGLRPHDQFIFGIQGFGLETVTQCMSIFLGEGVFEKWEDGWKLNQVISPSGMIGVETQYQMYNLDIEVDPIGLLTVYGFTGMMDAETGDGNDTHVVLRCGSF